MPHENIWDRSNTPDDNGNRVQISWGPPPDGIGDGHVMVAVERPETPARVAGSIQNAERGLLELLKTNSAPAWRTLRERLGDSNEEIAALLMDALGDQLVFGFGSPCTLLVVQLDREGCNRSIRALRKGRDNAYGKDE